MTKITVPSLLKRGLIVEVSSSNPAICFVSVSSSKYRQRLYLISGTHGNGRPQGSRAEKQKDFKVVATGRIFSRYVLTAGAYKYKTEGVLFLTTLEEVLVQCGFDVCNYPLKGE